MSISGYICGRSHKGDTEYEPLRPMSPVDSESNLSRRAPELRILGARKAVVVKWCLTIIAATALIVIAFFFLVFVVERYAVFAYESSGLALADPFEKDGNAADSAARWVDILSANVYPSMVHSHNDYLRPRPLFSALSVGCASVEADVWRTKDGKDLLVGHHWWSLSPAKTLQSLYIDPLLQILDSMNQQVLKDNPGYNGQAAGVFATHPNTTLILFIDVKDDPVTTWPLVLEQLKPLRDKGYLSRHEKIYPEVTNQSFWPGPVTVVGTGNIVKRRDVNVGIEPERWHQYHDVFLDASLDLIDRPGFCQRNDTYCLEVQENEFYTASVSFWRAIGTVRLGFGKSQLKTLRDQIHTARQLNLISRYWELPSWPISYRNYVWRILAQEGIGLLNADDISTSLSNMATKNIPPTMRAWTFSTGGAPEKVLSFHSDLPTSPPPKAAHVLVRISHAALSSAGTTLMRVVPSSLRKNAIPELDFSGRVVLAGPDVPAKFGPGTPVFGTVSKYATAVSGHGTLAEYISIGYDCIAIKPPNMSFAEAACLSVPGQVAMEMIRRAQVKQGDRVLINGGSGAVGTAAIQLAKFPGAHVVAVCSGSKADIAKIVGADEVVDYRQVKSVPQFLADTYKNNPFDTILDTVGSQTLFTESPRYLKAGGSVINVGEGDGNSGQLASILRAIKNSHQPSFLGGVPRKYVTFSAPLAGENAEHLASLAEQGKMRVFIDSMFALQDVLKAYERFASPDTRGRAVVTIGNFDEV
ncbi:hypothetical protein NM208_g6009 [Fusarium decemcellulare]|uniref:Uncharacterized protein n=1 Tax=Fusarium decemcellulare TaxID=57161 RepID=A0ACC1SER4_9HYPO|nr:hypothetical protein NM208_g6009 [Fusarium decemcellulare]